MPWLAKRIIVTLARSRESLHNGNGETERDPRSSALLCLNSVSLSHSHSADFSGIDSERERATALTCNFYLLGAYIWRVARVWPLIYIAMCRECDFRGSRSHRAHRLFDGGANSGVMVANSALLMLASSAPLHPAASVVSDHKAHAHLSVCVHACTVYTDRQTVTQ